MGTQGTAGKTKNPLKGIRVVDKTRPIGEMAYVSLKEAIVKGDLHPDRGSWRAHYPPGWGSAGYP